MAARAQAVREDTFAEQRQALEKRLLMMQRTLERERSATEDAQRAMGSSLQQQLKQTEAKLQELKRTDRCVV
jgi:hypothetical protein